MPTTRETVVPGKRRSKRSSCPPASNPTWAILYEFGAWNHDSDSNRDRAMSLSSTGEQICVSVKLVEPPRISILTVDLPQQQPPSTETILSDVMVVAAHRDVVLFQVNPRAMSESDSAPYDHFVYKASCGASERPSLLLLPLQYYCGEQTCDGRPRQLLLTPDSTGILSSGSSSMDNQDASFVVADLVATYPESKDRWCNNQGLREFDIHVLWSVSCKWMVFKNLHIHGANGGRDLYWWSTDAVVPYRSRYLLWVDYYRGIIFADMAGPEKKPDLRYVPLPVNPPKEFSNSNEWDSTDGRKCPKASRNLCATRSGIKFVSVDRQRRSNFGVRYWEWTSTFRVTTWSLREDGVTWRRDARLYAEDLWALDSKNRFPHVEPKFPVINMENPNAICFVADDDCYTPDSSNRVCMVEIDIKKKVLLAVTDYSMERLLFRLDSVKIATKLPHYRYAGEPCKKRRE
ncbi:hypothetical protein EJB05_57743, partial [Eragrostis curvula]